MTIGKNIISISKTRDMRESIGTIMKMCEDGYIDDYSDSSRDKYHKNNHRNSYKDKDQSRD